MVGLDAYISLIPKTDGDSTLLGQRPLCVLPIAYRLWASVRLQHLQRWFGSWVPWSVFSAGGGRSSVEVWYSAALVKLNRQNCMDSLLNRDAVDLLMSL